MGNFISKKTVKVISLMLSILLIWQGVVWANPEAFNRSTLQPRLFFDPEFAGKNFLSALGGNISKALGRFESSLDNRNLYAIRERAGEFVEDIRTSGDMPQPFLENIKGIKGSPESGEVFQDIGPIRIRYYDHRIPGSRDPGTGWSIVEGQDIKIGEYLSRQVLVDMKLLGRDASPSKDEDSFAAEVSSGGQIAYIDPSIENGTEAFFDAVVQHLENGGLREFDSSLRSKITSARRNLVVTVKASSLDEGLKSNLLDVIHMSYGAEFMDLAPLVLVKGEDDKTPAGWLLGFNTMDYSELPIGIEEDNINSSLKARYPDTIGLSGVVFDLIGKDAGVFEEYIFHEMICPVLGHPASREIQESLFADNYMGIKGEKGKKDGKLTLMLRQAIYRSFGRADEKADIDEDKAIDKEFEDFKRKKFKGFEPNEDTVFYTRYKKWLEKARSSDIAVSAAGYLGKANERYDYINARLNRVWRMSNVWDKAENILKGRDVSDLSKEESGKIRDLARELLKEHSKFLKKYERADLLKKDPYVTAAVEYIKGFASVRKDLGPIEDIGSLLEEMAVDTAIYTDEQEIGPVKGAEVSEEVAVSEKEDKKPEEKRQGLMERLRLFNWKGLVIMLSAGVVISGVLWMVLPVNVFTVAVAFILPVGLIAYLLAKRMTNWKAVAAIAGVSIILSMILPIPWFGLSLALVVLSRMALNRRRGGMQAASIKGGEQAKRSEKTAGKKETSGTDTGEKEDTSGADIKKAETEAGVDLLKNVEISGDILERMGKILNRQQAMEGKQDEKKELTTEDVLSAMFRVELIEDIPENEALREELRPIVHKKLLEMEQGYNFELANIVRKLKDWKQQTDEDLADALNEAVQELMRAREAWTVEEDQGGEILIIQELVGEYCGISKARLDRIRVNLVITNTRERIKFDKMLGSPVSGRYYFLGRLLFQVGDLDGAEDAFREAVNQDFYNADYFLTLSILQHHRKKWRRAKQGYVYSLRARDLKQGKTEEDEIKTELTKLLLKKVENNTGLDGKKYPPWYSCLWIHPDRVYVPFINAPVIEEIFKVGIPFGIYAALNALIPALGLLNKGIFIGLLISSGINFTLVHVHGKRGPPGDMGAIKKALVTLRTLDWGERALRLGAPLLVAVAGITAALIYMADPVRAISISMGAHLIANAAIFLIRLVTKKNVGYATIPEDFIEIPNVSIKLKPERELDERFSEERASIEIQKELTALAADLRCITVDQETADTEEKKEDLRQRKNSFLLNLRSLYQNMPVKIKEDEAYGYYSDLLKDLKRRREELYEKIEGADEAGNREALKRLNIEVIRNNRLILKTQVLMTGMMLMGKSGLKQPAMIRNAALWTLTGALNSAQMLEEELHYRVQRLRGAEKIQEIETTDWMGNIVRTFRLGGFDVEVLKPEEGEDEPRVSVRQQRWVNVHTVLDDVRKAAKRGDIKKAVEDLDMLLGLYSARYLVVMKSYRDIAAEIRAIKKEIMALPETHAPPKEIKKEITLKIEDIKEKIRQPKQRFWVEIEYASLAKTFHSRIHTIASYEPEYILIMKNKADLEYYAGRLKEAVEKDYLSKRRKTMILKGLAKQAEWAERGFVFPKQFAAIDLAPAIKLLDADDFAGAEKYLQDTMKELDKRLSEIDRIIGHVKKKASGIFSIFRDGDIKKRADIITGLVDKEEFDAALDHLKAIRELYFSQELVEPGYIRAENILRSIPGIVRSASRMKRSAVPAIVEITKRLDSLKLDIDHKYSLRVTVTNEGGEAKELFPNPGTTAAGILAMGKRDQNTTCISIGNKWIEDSDLGSVKVPEGAKVTLRKKETVPQMGRRSQMGDMGPETLTANVSDSKGVSHQITLTHQPEFRIDAIKRAIPQIQIIDDKHKEILLSMLSLFENSPPALYTFDTLIEDLFGFAIHPGRSQNHSTKTPNGMIAVHSSLTEVDESLIALMHEILEFLIDSGKLHIEFHTSSLFITDNKGIFFELPLTNESALYQVKKLENPENASMKAHYLLRAMQREMFGNFDKGLTGKIKGEQGIIGEGSQEESESQRVIESERKVIPAMGKKAGIAGSREQGAGRDDAKRPAPSAKLTGDTNSDLPQMGKKSEVERVGSRELGVGRKENARENDSELRTANYELKEVSEQTTNDERRTTQYSIRNTKLLSGILVLGSFIIGSGFTAGTGIFNTPLAWGISGAVLYAIAWLAFIKISGKEEVLSRIDFSKPYDRILGYLESQKLISKNKLTDISKSKIRRLILKIASSKGFSKNDKELIAGKIFGKKFSRKEIRDILKAVTAAMSEFQLNNKKYSEGRRVFLKQMALAAVAGGLLSAVKMLLPGPVRKVNFYFNLHASAEDIDTVKDLALEEIEEAKADGSTPVWIVESVFDLKIKQIFMTEVLPEAWIMAGGTRQDPVAFHRKILGMLDMIKVSHFESEYKKIFIDGIRETAERYSKGQMPKGSGTEGFMGNYSRFLAELGTRGVQVRYEELSYEDSMYREMKNAVSDFMKASFMFTADLDEFLYLYRELLVMQAELDRRREEGYGRLFGKIYGDKSIKDPHIFAMIGGWHEEMLKHLDLGDYEVKQYKAPLVDSMKGSLPISRKREHAAYTREEIVRHAAVMFLSEMVFPSKNAEEMYKKTVYFRKLVNTMTVRDLEAMIKRNTFLSRGNINKKFQSRDFIEIQDRLRNNVRSWLFENQLNEAEQKEFEAIIGQAHQEETASSGALLSGVLAALAVIRGEKAGIAGSREQGAGREQTTDEESESQRVRESERKVIPAVGKKAGIAGSREQGAGREQTTDKVSEIQRVKESEKEEDLTPKTQHPISDTSCTIHIPEGFSIIHSDQLTVEKKAEMIKRVIKKYKADGETNIDFDNGMDRTRDGWVFIFRGDEPVGFKTYGKKGVEYVGYGLHVFRDSRKKGLGRLLIREMVEKLRRDLEKNPETYMLTSTRLTEQGEKIWRNLYGDKAGIKVSDDGAKRINMDLRTAEEVSEGVSAPEGFTEMDRWHMSELLLATEDVISSGEEDSRIPVVARVVDSKGNEIATAVRLKHDETKYGVKALHSEINAIRIAEEEKGFSDWENATMYVNLESCYNCARALTEFYGFKKVVYGAKDTSVTGADREPGLYASNGVELVECEDTAIKEKLGDIFRMDTWRQWDKPEVNDIMLKRAKPKVAEYRKKYQEKFGEDVQVIVFDADIWREYGDRPCGDNSIGATQERVMFRFLEWSKQNLNPAKPYILLIPGRRSDAEIIKRRVIEDGIFDEGHIVVEQSTADLTPKTQHPRPDLTTREGILENAKTIVPTLANAMITISQKERKPVLAIDSSLGEGEVNAMLTMLIKTLPEIDDNNRDLKRFLRDLVRINGKGADLAQRIENITNSDRGGIKAEDVIVITKEENMKLFNKKSTIVGVDDEGLPEDSYLPLLEIILFAIGKHLGWSKEELLRHYAMIPNVSSTEDLSEEDLKKLFDENMGELVIRVLKGKDAIKFKGNDRRIINDQMLLMLARA